MDYQKMYNKLIAFRQVHIPQGYVEHHHIVMRSMGGSDDDTNLVALTGREHWIAHLLLYKIYKNPQTSYACHMMAMRCEERGIPYVRNSRMYEKIRIQCAKHIGLNNSRYQAGKGNSQYGTQWICNLELNENKKILKNNPIPDGWTVGRIVAGHKHTQDSKEKIRKAILSYSYIWIHNPNLQKSIRISSNDLIPDGWILGMFNQKSFNYKECKFCKTEIPPCKIKNTFCNKSCKTKFQHKNATLKDL
jgi:hypothetical protein